MMELLNKLPGFPVYIVFFIIFTLGSVIAVVATSFLKLVVVMHITKNALGLHEVPPGVAINALGLILTIYIMAPVGMQMANTFQAQNPNLDNLRDPQLLIAAEKSVDPLRNFLYKHSSTREREFFVKAAKKIWPPEFYEKLEETNLLVLIPAFTTSQLKSAFEVGFLIYLPFIIIDLIVSNILLALGMIMVSPIIISMPFKLLLFVTVDGWSRLLHGLVLSYQ